MEVPSVSVECSICNQRYRDPKVLPCFHCFCRDCIESLRVRNRNFHCPECYRDATLPDGDAENLPDAFPVYHRLEVLQFRQRLDSIDHGIQCDSCSRGQAEAFCHDCGQYICNECTGKFQHSDHRVVPFKELSRTPDNFPCHQVLTRARSTCANDRFLQCRKHFDRRICYYCNCGELICEACADKEHKEHEHKYLNQAVKESKREIAEQLPNIRVVHKRIAGAAATVPGIRENVEDQGKSLADSVDSSFERLHRMLDRHKADMKTRISQMTKSKVMKLGEQQSELESISAEMQRLEDFITNCLQTSTERELLLLNKFLQERITQALQQYSRVDVEPVETPNLALKISCAPYLREACRKHAVVYNALANSFKSVAEGPGLKSAETMKVATFTVIVFDKSGNACMSTQNVSVEVKCLSDGSVLQADVSDMGQGKYQVSYCPKSRGDHEISVCVNDKMIPRSPFSLVVWQSPSQLGRSQGIIDGVTGPRGLVLKENGNLLVCEWNGGRVVELDDLGRQVQIIGSGQLSHPASVAVNQQGTIYVVDVAGERSCVKKFSHNGILISSVGREGAGLGEFKNPRGVTLNNRNKRNELLVCDRDNYRIQAFNSNLEPVRHIELKNLDQQFAKPSQPNDIAFDSSGNMFVADYANDCILAFTVTEQYSHSFSMKGSDQGCLAGPESIHIDKDLIYVTESKNHCVSVFRSTGEFVTSFGKIGKSAGELKLPMGIVTNKNGMVYVCELLNNRIQVF